MKIFKKEISAYLRESAIFIFIVFLINVLNYSLISMGYIGYGDFTPLLVFETAFVFLAGWGSARRRKYTLRQSGFLGIILFLSAGWSIALILLGLPYEFGIYQQTFLLVLNSVFNAFFYIGMTLLGFYIGDASRKKGIVERIMSRFGRNKRAK